MYFENLDAKLMSNISDIEFIDDKDIVKFKNRNFPGKGFVARSGSKKMKIAFHDNCLSLRGTTVAIYDWAYWTRHYLDVDPVIMYDESHPPTI